LTKEEEVCAFSFIGEAANLTCREKGQLGAVRRVKNAVHLRRQNHNS